MRNNKVSTKYHFTNPMSKAKPQQHVFLQYLCPPKSQECKALPSNAPELLSKKILDVHSKEIIET